MNSINWARILAQTVYYFLSFFHARRLLASSSGHPNLQYVVPTGNFGDVLAGYYAKHMGLPISLGIATNANDILARFWASGAYEKHAPTNSSEGEGAAAPAEGASDGRQAASAPGGVKETLSPAMDILVSSNFERLLWYLAREAVGTGVPEEEGKKQAGATLAGWMASVKSDGRVQVPTEVLEAARRDFLAEKVSDEQVRLHVFGALVY